MTERRRLRSSSAMSTVTSRLERGMVSAEQLADLIARKINVAGVEIAVRKHHAFGWTPTVLSAPANPISFQRRAEEIAQRLKVQFELQD